MDDLSGKLDLIDMEDFLCSQGVDYRMGTGSSGTQINVKECPRCQGDSWKVFLNAESGLGNCFHGSCVGEPGFNKFSFIRCLENDSSRDAIALIDEYARDLGWRPKRKRAASLMESLFELPEHESIERDSEAAVYLARRGFDEKVIRYFDWRYCEFGFYPYTDYEGKKRRQSYDDRILVPVCDLKGEMVTFQGRDISNTKDRKYLFPPGLKGTGHLLYNAHNVVGLEHIVLGEGVFDVAAIKVALGEDPQFKRIGAAGTFGKSVSHKDNTNCDDQMGQLRMLQAQGLQKVTFMWDGELRTLHDAADAALIVRRAGFEVYLAELPSNKDPNEVGTAVVREAFERAALVSVASVNRLKMKWRLQARRLPRKKSRI